MISLLIALLAEEDEQGRSLEARSEGIPRKAGRGRAE